MKNPLIPVLIGLAMAALLTGCSWDVRLGGGSKTSNTATRSDEKPTIGQQVSSPTLGQQLVDLQKAKESGAITEEEYQAQKAKLLQNQ